MNTEILTQSHPCLIISVLFYVILKADLLAFNFFATGSFATLCVSLEKRNFCFEAKVNFTF